MREGRDKISKKVKNFAEFLEETAILDCTDGDGIPHDKIVKIYNKIDGIRQDLINLFSDNNIALVFGNEIKDK